MQSLRTYEKNYKNVFATSTSRLPDDPSFRTWEITLNNSTSCVTETVSSDDTVYTWQWRIQDLTLGGVDFETLRNISVLGIKNHGSASVYMYIVWKS